MPFMYHNCSANTRETCANAANYEKCCFMSEWRRLPLPQRRSSEFARCRQGSHSQNVPRDFHFDSCRQNPHSLLESLFSGLDRALPRRWRERRLEQKRPPSVDLMRAMRDVAGPRRRSHVVADNSSMARSLEPMEAAMTNKLTNHASLP